MTKRISKKTLDLAIVAEYSQPPVVTDAEINLIALDAAAEAAAQEISDAEIEVIDRQFAEELDVEELADLDAAVEAAEILSSAALIDAAHEAEALNKPLSEPTEPVADPVAVISR
jgi:hypothetical protein